MKLLAVIFFCWIIVVPVFAASAKDDSVTECIITYQASDSLERVIRENGFKFDGYDRLCNSLETQGMGIHFTHSTGILVERTYGWITIRFFRIHNKIYGEKGRSATSISTYTDFQASDRTLMDALSRGLKYVAEHQEDYIQSVEDEELRLRKLFSSEFKTGEMVAD